MQNVLPTKLIRPHLRETVRYSRREGLLEGVISNPITTVNAGAGYGKTIFTAQALENQDVVWYRIDCSDADFTTFMLHLATGIRKFCPEFGGLTLSRLEETHGSVKEIEAVMSLFLKEFEETVTKDLFMVYDDYHLIQDSPGIHRAMQFLLENLPGYAHVVIISRSRIHLPLSRFRANRELHEVTVSDLRLNTTEIISLYKGLFGMEINEKIATGLEQRTQGWISGLILFHYVMQGKSDKEIETMLKGIKGYGRIVSEYLEENVFVSLSPEKQDFLMRTSILTRLNAEMCDSLMDNDGSSAMLRSLVEDHLFTFPLDEDGREYSYHHLFQEFLGKRLRETWSREKLAGLHIRAAGIMETAGDHEQALKHYLTAGDYEQAGRTLSIILPELMYRGRLELMQACLLLTPGQLIAQHPWFCFLKASHDNLSGRFRDSLTHYQKALYLFRTRNIQTGIDLCLNELGMRYYLTGDFDKAEQVYTQLLKSPEISTYLKIEAYVHLIYIISYMGRFQEADEYFNQANLLLEKTEDKNLREMYHIWLVVFLALRHVFAGEHEKAVSLTREVLEPIKRIGYHRLSTVCYHVFATACFYAGAFSEGLEYAQTGLKIVEEKGLRDTLLGWLKCLVSGNTFGMGNITDSLRYGIESRKHFQDLGSPFGEAYACHFLQNALLAKGRFQEAEEMGRSGLSAIKGMNLPIISCPILLSIAEGHIQCGKFTEAEEAINRARDSISYSKFLDWWIARMRARLLWETGRRDEAACALESGLVIAQTFHYDRWIVSDRPWIIQVLALVYSRGHHQAYIREIIALMGSQAVVCMRRLQKDKDQGIAVAAKEILTDLPAQVIAGLNVRCLGKFEVMRGNEMITPQHWNGRNVKMLFKLLVFYRPQGFISKEIFMEHLWPEGDPVKTAKRFHVTLAYLRKAMEPAIEKGIPSAYLKNDGDSYMLNLGTGGLIDAEEFEKACRLAHETENRDEADEHLLRAVRLYSGDYLVEDLYEPWCCQERERLREIYLSALAGIIEYHVTRKDYHEAIESCRTYLEKEPYAEDIYQQLMQLYALTGNRAMVKKTFDACCRYIKDDLGMELSRDTVILLEELGPA